MAFALVRSDILYAWKGPSLLIVERGRHWSGHTRRSGVYTKAALHPDRTAGVAGLLAGAALAYTVARKWFHGVVRQ